MHNPSAPYNWTKSHFISVLSSKAVKPEVLEALARVERERFLPASLASAAYNDRSIVDPATGVEYESPVELAKGLSQLDIQPGEVVIEAGTGSGYLTALLALLVGPAGKVLSVERNLQILENARRKLQEFRYDIGFSNMEILFANVDQIDLSSYGFNKAFLSFSMQELHPRIAASLLDKGRALFPRSDGKLLMVEKISDQLFGSQLLGQHSYAGHKAGVE